MKRVLLVGILLIGFCIVPALAHDHDSEPASPWSGWYLGFGLSSASGQWDVNGSADGGEVLHGTEDNSGGWNAAFGYNFQISDSFLLGLEGSYMSTELRGTAAPGWSYAPGDVDGAAHATYRMPRIASLVGRLGFVAGSGWMLHVDAGLARGTLYHQWSDLDSLDEGEFGGASKDASGVVLGIGAAWSINSQWAFTIDYRSIDFDKETFDYGDIDSYGLPWRFNVDPQVDTLNFGLTYKF